ncbi:MAG: DUF4445 domain-containing protein [Acutalibacter sp.]|uniref:ASKHA domain-containing protein n=1 Tax=Acutalibacter sp. TaxID=1918636 RepID=UPI00216D7CD2|nr:ASKHA domain-containing protein [Acutalibacter sp.]MCI9224850.1 DUF4445 domain-containing protein [Acutalibacter sp.]
MAVVKVNGKPIEAPAGSLLSDILPENSIETPCGGRGSCGKCRVIAYGMLSKPSLEELACLTAQEMSEGLRLACCTRIEGDCAVTLKAAGESWIKMDNELPELELHPAFTRYGAAVDVGTTTLAACLYGADGERLAQAGGPNPQHSWGADVISRVEAALKGEGPALAGAVREGIGELLRELSHKAGIGPELIDQVVITGNTVMLYLLTGTGPDSLARAPFMADRLFGEELLAAELGLPCIHGTVYLPRCISAFVGGDITTALVYSGICNGAGTKLLADVGTNGEMALWHKGRLTCCSTAAGPAFEGAGLSMGLPGKAGAVDHACVKDGSIVAHVLGEMEPIGICGSGVVDALACLLELGILDDSGFLEEDPVMIAPPVCLTQQDIRMVQLAKSAVSAGIRTLIHRAGITCREIDELAVAGGFGSYLDVGNAGKLGLLPGELVQKVRVIGNAALSGASMLLLNRDLRKYSESLAAQAETVDLSTDPFFMEAYTEGMLF